MSIPGAASPLFLGAAVAEAAAFQIDRSLRITKGDQAYLNRTPSSAGNRKTFTLSFWIKRTIPVANFSPTTASVFSASAGGSSWFDISFYTVDELQVITNAGVGDTGVRTQAVYRDFSSWYHFVVAVDTTNSTAADRIIIYVNGVRQAVNTPSGMPSQNSDTLVNATNAHYFGRDGRSSSVRYGDNYFAEIYFVDGQALAPTDFGETDDNNNWNPKAYSGTYGTNGFHLLDFANESTIGNDSSGNNNDWTANNLQSSDGPIYSSFGSGTASGTKTYDKAFDGSLSTFCEPNDNQTITFDFTSLSGGGIAVSSSLRMYLNKAGTPAAGHFTVNGTNLGGSIPSGDWLTISSVSLLETITFFHASGSSSVELYAVEVDGAILVDGNFGDVFRDTPTNYEASSGNNGGNYAILNPVDPSTSYQGTYANGNLEFTKTGSTWASAKASIGMTSGKWYCEVTTIDTGTNNIIGVHDETSIQDYLDRDASGYGWRSDGAKVNNNTVGTNIGSYGAGDVMGLAFDADAKALYFYKNNSLAGSFTGITPSDGTYFFAFTQREGKTITVNFGQRPFAYTPPTGYVSLCTQNLTDPTIADGSTAMDVALYTGNGANTNTISGLSMSPDLVWLKRRDSASHHAWYDAVRGAYKHIGSSHTSAEYTESTGRGLSAFNSDGFTIDTSNGEHVGNGSVNVNNATYAAFCWDGGTTTASNTDGSVTSNVRANASAGFSIVTYTGTGSGTVTVGHGLNDKPELIIVKDRDATDNWWVQHGSQGHTKIGFLNLTNAFGSTSFWGAAPTSSVFSIGSSGNNANDFVAYCFAPVSQFSSFGSYTGNGSSDGPFVALSFRPAVIILKRTDSNASWQIRDTSRSPHNVVTENLYPNLSNAESTDSSLNLDILSNGFKPRTSTDGGSNASGGTYIYACFAESPFKYARAR